MRTPRQALLWELWRTGRFEWSLRTGLACGMTLLLAAFSGAVRANPVALQAVTGMMTAMFLFNSVFSSIWCAQFDNSQPGFSFRLGFTRPISTATLVGVPMAFIVASTVIAYVLPALTYRIFVAAELPLRAPVMLSAALVACCVAATWSPATRTGKAFSFLALCAVLIPTLRGILPIGDNGGLLLIRVGDGVSWHWTWWHDAGSVAVVAVATWWTIRGVSRQRHQIGSYSPPRPALETNGRLDSAGRLGTASTQVQPGDASGGAAARRPSDARLSWTSVLFRWTGNRGRLWTQTWFEFRRAGVLACGVGVVIPLVILAFLAIAARTGEGVRNLPLLLTLVWLSTPIYGHLIGAEAMTGLRHRQGTTDLSPFDAAQPFRNDQLIAAKLLAMTVSSAAAWVCSSVAIGAYYLILADRGAWHEGVESLLELLGRATAPTWVLGVSSALLTFVSGTSALLIVSMWLPRYPRRMAAAMLFGFAHLVVAAVDARFGGALHEAWIVYGYVVAAAVASTCTYLVRKAWRSGAVGRRFATGVGTVWLAYVVSAVWLASRMNLPASVPAVVWCLAAALLLTPLAAALLAPLALGACRHA